MLVAGGYNGAYLSGSEVLDATRSRWNITAHLNFRRGAHVACPLPGGGVIVIGGVSGAYYPPEPELYVP